MGSRTMTLKPKSVSLTFCCSSSKSTFSSLMSRWMMQLSCMYSTAASSCRKTLRASPSLRRCLALTYEQRLPPPAYSMAMWMRLGESIISSSRMMCGWLRRSMSRISCCTRRQWFGSVSLLFS